MRAIRVTLRVLLGIGGGYAMSAAASAALALVLSTLAGFDRGDATVLCAMLGFGFYLFALLWAFTTPHLRRLGLVMLGGCLLFYGVVHWLSPASTLSATALGIPLAIPLGMGG